MYISNFLQQQYGYGSVAAGAQYPYAYGQQMGYWYPQAGYPAAASAAQMQNQFLQGMQGYSYGNFGYQQGYMGYDEMIITGDKYDCWILLI